MKKKFIFITILAIFLLSILSPGTTSASGTSVFKSNYPKQTIRSTISVDLDKDKKKETVILTKQGNLYLVKGKKVSLSAKGIIAEDMGPPKLTKWNPAKGEYQIITRNFYGPNNTVASVFKMKKGKLVRIHQVMGDLGIRIGKKKLYQDWKLYKDNGGYYSVTAVYTWNNKKQKFTSSGVVPE